MLDVNSKYKLDNLDPKWDNKKIKYDLLHYNWPAKFLEATREKFPNITDLTEIHTQLSVNDLVTLRKHLEAYTRSAEFSAEVDKFVHDVVSVELEDTRYPDEYLVQYTAGLRIVVPDQQAKNRLLNFHTGYWTGYDNGTNTIWTPITDAYDTNTMYVTDWDTSHSLMKRIHDERWPMEKIQSECEKVSWPVDVKVGESYLFNQGHLHGNVNNETGKTRMSFDVRIAHRDIDFGRRRPGSFYRIPNQYNMLQKEKIDKDKNWLVFVSPNDEYINMAPYFMIREYLLNWCETLGIKPNEWSNEYHECQWMPKLYDFVSRKNTGIVFPSIYNFSITPDERYSLFEQAIENHCQLIFCDENLIVNKKEDIEIIKKYYDFYYN